MSRDFRLHMPDVGMRAGATLSTACVFAFLWVWRLPCEAAEPINPGTNRSVELNVNGNTFAIRMVFVPAETRRNAGAEGGEIAKPQILQPFYFAENELSLADFNALASGEIRNAHDAREQTMASEDDQKRDWEEMQRNAQAYVAKMVTPDEAAGITAAANAALAKPAGPLGPTLTTERFRLPTAAEWRHAMSMGSQPDKKYINPWPDFGRDFTDKERMRCQELWASCGGKELFVGTQEQVIWAVQEASDKTAEKLELLTTFTRFLLNGRMLDPRKPNSYSWEILAEPLAERIDAAPGNEWGIRGAHRGYPEWVLCLASQNEAREFWGRFESSHVSDADRQRAALGLCGASSFTLGKDDLKPMLQAFVSHESRVINGKAEFSWQEAEDAELCIDRSVAMRLVLVKCLSDSWVGIVRTSIAKHDTVAVAKEATQGFLQQLETLTSGAELQRSQAIINAYLALSEYRCGEPSSGARRLAASVPIAFGQTSTVDAVPNLGRRRRNPASGGQAARSPKNADAVYFANLSRLMDRDVASPEP